MDKQEFLNGLKKHISILDEGEQRDILDEYTQHIDMKMSRGLSEEEAIHDFGNLEELAAEILEAYHVNPDYGRGPRENFAVSVSSGIKSGFCKMAAACGKAACAGWRFVSHTLPHGFGIGIHKLAAGIACPFEKLGGMWKKWSENRGAVSAADRNDTIDVTSKGNDVTKKKRFKLSFRWPVMTKKGEEEEKRRMEKRSSGILLAWKHFWRSIGRVIRWCLRWFWNIIIIFLAVWAGLSACLLILTFGVSLVFLIAGYPFVGITVAVFGMAVCMATLTILLWRLMPVKKKDGLDEQKESDRGVKLLEEAESLDVLEIATSEEREVEYHA